MATDVKYVYSFGPSKCDGNAGMRALLGGKGANLAEMTNLGLPVPAGFTIGTNVCTYFYDHERSYPPELRKAVTFYASFDESIKGDFGGGDLNVGTRFPHPTEKGQFEQAYMRALYDYGYRQIKSGQAWHKLPPGLAAPNMTETR